jgi:CrcB protein
MTSHHYPVDPDLEPERRGAPTPLHARVLAIVFVGGCVGGWVRYAVTSAWSGSGSAFPWSTWTVNVAGAFVLGVVVGVDEWWRGRYLRALAGTGFCGALTTFGALVVSTDRLLAHGHVATAVTYLVASAAAGVAAALLGVVTARRVVPEQDREAG